MKKESLSVIIPTYNSKKWINRTLDSLINQSLDIDYEIIVIDDGSTDGTYEYIKKNYPKKNIKIYKKENGGVSSARNYGINMSTKNYIVFVDSDDFVDFNYFEIIANSILINSDFYFFGNRRLSSNKKKEYYVTRKNKYASKNELKEIIEKELINSPCNKIYATEILKKHNIKFNENISIAEDYLFNMTYLSKCDKVFLINENIYNYVLNANESSLTKRYNPKKYNEFTEVDEIVDSLNMDIYKKQINFIKLKHLYSCLIDEVVVKNDDIMLKRLLEKIEKFKIYDIKSFLLVKVFPRIGIKNIKIIIKKHKSNKF